MAEQKEPLEVTLPDRGLLGVGRDGASVNGKIDRLIKSQFGLEVDGVHCGAHRVNLVTSRNSKYVSARPFCNCI